ncbi:hypothetical protein BD311DRAFT_112658 [Dichomitus squalens]|uniref:Uncharacterized protein n=1 Tax=Dichomitus squalens TaxID=114155 RepID=A0A4Q9M9P5_9APHY|nr:hypothetical protein BD311DRAFT_112658 [Dichomitus squalens]
MFGHVIVVQVVLLSQTLIGLSLILDSERMHSVQYRPFSFHRSLVQTELTTMALVQHIAFAIPMARQQGARRCGGAWYFGTHIHRRLYAPEASVVRIRVHLPSAASRRYNVRVQISSVSPRALDSHDPRVNGPRSPRFANHAPRTWNRGTATRRGDCLGGQLPQHGYILQSFVGMRTRDTLQALVLGRSRSLLYPQPVLGFSDTLFHPWTAFGLRTSPCSEGEVALHACVPEGQTSQLAMQARKQPRFHCSAVAGVIHEAKMQ